MAGKVWTWFERFTTLVLLIAALVMIWSTRQPRALPAFEDAIQTADEVSGLLPPDVASTAARRGAEKAKFALVEFSDYQCPFCGKSARELGPQIQRDFVEPGRMTYLFLNFPLEQLHPNAFKASEAAECAKGQGKYWEMHDLLFSNQAALSRPDLSKYSAAVGLKREAFDTCLEGQTAPKVRNDIALARMFGFNGTPGFLLGRTKPDGGIQIERRIRGVQSYSAFKAILNQYIG